MSKTFTSLVHRLTVLDYWHIESEAQLLFKGLLYTTKRIKLYHKCSKYEGTTNRARVKFVPKKLKLYCKQCKTIVPKQVLMQIKLIKLNDTLPVEE